MSNAAGFRKPTLNEKRQVAEYMGLNNKRIANSLTIASRILFAVALFFIIIGMSSHSEIIAALSFISIFVFLAAIICIMYKNSYIREIEIYKKGDFMVCDGFVSQVLTFGNGDYADVWFTSKDGDIDNGWHRTPKAGARKGCPMILVKPINGNPRLEWHAFLLKPNKELRNTYLK